MDHSQAERVIDRTVTMLQPSLIHLSGLLIDFNHFLPLVFSTLAGLVAGLAAGLGASFLTSAFAAGFAGALAAFAGVTGVGFSATALV
jgi:hypothetical protein